jgi:hypothetical protein
LNRFLGRIIAMPNEIELSAPARYGGPRSITDLKIQTAAICGLWCKELHGSPFVNVL